MGRCWIVPASISTTRKATDTRISPLPSVHPCQNPCGAPCQNRESGNGVRPARTTPQVDTIRGRVYNKVVFNEPACLTEGRKGTDAPTYGTGWSGSCYVKSQLVHRLLSDRERRSPVVLPPPGLFLLTVLPPYSTQTPPEHCVHQSPAGFPGPAYQMEKEVVAADSGFACRKRSLTRIERKER